MDCFNVTLIKLFSDESESEETSSNKRPKLKENSKEPIKNTAKTELTEKEKNYKEQIKKSPKKRKRRKLYRDNSQKRAKYRNYN